MCVLNVYQFCPDPNLNRGFLLPMITNGKNRKSLLIRIGTQKSALFLVPVSVALAIGLWALIVHLGDFPPVILPGPGLIWRRFIQVLMDGSLLRHSMYTLFEVLAGLFLGGSTATILGYLLAKSITIERILAPYIVASQSVPTVAIAPLLIIWFGSGPFSKVLISALIVFFPILVNTIVGVRSVPDELRDLMRSLLATRWQTFTRLEVPAALPVFLGGLKVGATLSVIGAVVGEFVGADRGLGYMINRSRGQYDTALVFVAVLTLVAMAMALYGSVVWLDSYLLAWSKKPEKPIVSGR
jgi:NitT/TauT family transport system permease protein